MNYQLSELELQLNGASREVRLNALREIRYGTLMGRFPEPPHTHYVNNHIHTNYSFSPYSPAKALYLAWKSGLKTAGIMDHDSLAGAEEFLAAGEILGMPVTVGLECRIRMEGSLAGRRLNNPDQISIAYAAIHGIPHQHIQTVQKTFAPLRALRNRRNEVMCGRLSKLLAPVGIAVDFQKDVLPLSQFAEGGSVTERHILFALAQKLMHNYPSPSALLSFLKNELKLPVGKAAEERLLDGGDTPELYPYDLLGILKSALVEAFYTDADRECMDAASFIALTERINAYSAYAYLGDVQKDVTGDKKTQAFEDSYLDLLFSELAALRFRAVTYMPTRNTPEQLTRVMALCRKYGMFQISGEDINSPRQSFICRALDDPQYRHLIDATYTLIGREAQLTRKIPQLDEVKSIPSSPLTELCALETELKLSSVLLAKFESRTDAAGTAERHAAYLTADAEARGVLHADSVIIVPAAKESGIGWAAAAAKQGRRICLVLTEAPPPEAEARIRALGADIRMAETSGAAGTAECMRKIAAGIPNAVLLSDLYASPEEAAFDQGIGPELWCASGGSVDLLIGSIANIRLLSSASAYLKKRNPSLQTAAVSSEEADIPEKIAIYPDETYTKEIDSMLSISAEDARNTSLDLMRMEGIEAQTEAGAVVHAAILMSALPEFRGKTVLLLLPDAHAGSMQTPEKNSDII